MEAGLAVRLPRGAHPRRRATTSSTRSPTCRSSCVRTADRRDQGVPQRLSASRSPPEGLRRPLLTSSAARSTASPGRSTARWPHVPAAWDFPHVDDEPDDFHLPEPKVGTWAGFVFINPDPDCGAARRVPRRPGRALRRLGSRQTATSKPTSPRSSTPTGRSRRRRSARRTTSTAPTRRSWRTSATPTARSTSGTTSRA